MRFFVPITALVLLAAGCSRAPEVVIEPATPQVVFQSSPEVGTGDVSASSTGIFVDGRASVSGAPDTLTVDIGVEVMERTVSEAVEHASVLADSLISALEAEGIATADIQTAQFSIFPEYDFRSDHERIIGYRVSNFLTVRVRDIGSAGDVIDAAAVAGGDAVRIHGLRFVLEDNEALVRAAREAAWQDALDKAQQLADLSGRRLGPAQTITESLVPALNPLRGFAFEGAAAFSTRIEPGELMVNVSIQVQFSMLP